MPVSPSSGLTYANVTVTHLGIWLKENFLVIVMLLNALLVTITQSIPLSTPVNFMVSPLACVRLSHGFGRIPDMRLKWA